MTGFEVSGAGIVEQAQRFCVK